MIELVLIDDNASARRAFRDCAEAVARDDAEIVLNRDISLAVSAANNDVFAALDVRRVTEQLTNNAVPRIVFLDLDYGVDNEALAELANELNVLIEKLGDDRLTQAAWNLHRGEVVGQFAGLYAGAMAATHATKPLMIVVASTYLPQQVAEFIERVARVANTQHNVVSVMGTGAGIFKGVDLQTGIGMITSATELFRRRFSAFNAYELDLMYRLESLTMPRADVHQEAETRPFALLGKILECFRVPGDCQEHLFREMRASASATDCMVEALKGIGKCRERLSVASAWLLGLGAHAVQCPNQFGDKFDELWLESMPCDVDLAKDAFVTPEQDEEQQAVSARTLYVMFKLLFERDSLLQVALSAETGFVLMLRFDPSSADGRPSLRQNIAAIQRDVLGCPSLFGNSEDGSRVEWRGRMTARSVCRWWICSESGSGTSGSSLTGPTSRVFGDPLVWRFNLERVTGEGRDSSRQCLTKVGFTER